MRVILFFAAAGALCFVAACGTPTQVLPPADATGAQAIASPSPSPSPSPVATPTPPPEPEPSPEVNDRPVDRVTASVYYVICDNEIVPNSQGAREAGVGCRVHLDATPKDDEGEPTIARYPVEWRYSQPQLLDIVVRNPLGPIITTAVPHRQEIYVRVDGVDSNRFSITFVAR